MRKLSNDPGICTLIEKAAAAWVISEQQSDSSDINSHTASEIDRSWIIQEGEEAKATVLRYADWLVTTCNAAIPDDFCSLPVPHPCTISITPASIGYTTCLCMRPHLRMHISSISIIIRRPEEVLDIQSELIFDNGMVYLTQE